MTKSIEALIAGKGNAVTGNYYLAKCENCEEMFSSGKMTGGEPLYSGDYGDSYCPHCGVDDSEISDCGNDALEAWNFQQKHIDALIAALERSHKQCKEWSALSKRNIDERVKDISALNAAQARVAELEALCVKSDAMREVAPLCVKLPNRWHARYNTISGGFNEKRYDQDVISAIRAAGGSVEGSD